jgi:hypothetical protein
MEINENKIIKIDCPLCDTSCNSIRSITHHFRCNHKENPRDTLLKVYPSLFKECKKCFSKLKYYITDSQARKYCSNECYISDISGKKQSAETIEKRISNTDQHKKEKKRQETFITRYSSLHAPKDPEAKKVKISIALKGKKHTAEHHIRVIESKTKNNTLNHTEETKKKISESLKRVFRSETFDKTKFLSNKVSSYNYGYHKGFYCRSSYEKKFIDFCEIYKVKLLSAENNKFSIKYKDDKDVTRTYFPDFYLPEFDIIVEIKALGMYDHNNNINKFSEMMKVCKFMVITEDDYLLEDDKWDYLYQELSYA